MAVVTLAVALAGCAAEPREERIRAPGADLLGPAPRANEPFLGIKDWVMIVQVASIIITVVFLAVLIRSSLRRRKHHPALTVFLAFWVMSLIDPWGLRGSFIALNPQGWHLPTSWPYVSLAPTVEWWVNLFGYPYFFIIPGLVAIWLTRRRWISGARPDSFVKRRPLWTLFFVGLLIGAIYDLAFELFLTRAEIYVYTQVVGGLSLRAGSTWQFPLYEVALVSIIAGLAAVLLWEDDAGRSMCDRVAARWKLLGRRPALGALAVAMLVLCSGYGALQGGMWAISATKVARTVGKPWPYLDTKVYDPQGFYQRAGVPGPYFK